MKKASQIREIYQEFSDIKQVLNERSIRWWCASKSLTYNRLHGFGGVSIVSEATGVSRNRIYRALLEMEEGEKETTNLRKKGGGRKKNNNS